MMFTITNRRTIFTFWVFFFNFINTSQQVTPAEEKVAQVELARLAKETKRHGDMAGAMKKAVQTGVELTAEEQNLLSFAFKSIVDVRRSGWLVARGKEKGKYHLNVLNNYMTKLEKELNIICNDLLKLLEALIKKTSNEKSKVFYLTMKGDYHRYLAEIKVGDENKAEVEKSRKAYEEAFKTSKQIMKATDPIRLGIAIKLGVLFNDILKSPGEAYKLSSVAAGEAEAEILVKNSKGETIDEGQKQLVQLLESNMLDFKKNMEQAKQANV